MTEPKPNNEVNQAARTLRALRTTYTGAGGRPITKTCTCQQSNEPDWHKHKHGCPVYRRKREAERRAQKKAEKQADTP